MAIKLLSEYQNKINKEWIRKYLIDSIYDVEKLPKCGTQSTATVAAKGGAVFIVNAEGEWVEYKGNPGDVPSILEMNEKINELETKVKNSTKMEKIRMQVSNNIVKCDYDAKAIADMMLPNSFVIIERIGLNADYSTGMVYSCGYDVIIATDSDYNYIKYQYRFNFPNNLQSIIVDVLNNTLFVEE